MRRSTAAHINPNRQDQISAQCDREIQANIAAMARRENQHFGSD
jgi:hypothetical protein